jgi:light-regulated signal transduction histidine kinase (bacteriophytochrome)
MNTEKELEDKVLELERKLQERGNELYECKKETGKFIHMASHDLQAPVRKLSTFVERLTYKSSHLLGEEALCYITRIEKTVTIMRSLIDSLTELSEVSVAEFDFKICDLNEVLHAAITDLVLPIKENDADIKVSPLPKIVASALQLKTAFKHLIANSIKFKKEGLAPQMAITCELLQAEEKNVHGLLTDTTYYKIEFKDNGIGFSAQHADKIFHPFQHLHGKSAYKGNGLGLATCKKIIEKHQGIMYAKPNKDSGAVFVLILPSIHN